MALIFTESFRSISASSSKWNLTIWNNTFGTGTDGLAGAASNQFGTRQLLSAEEDSTLILGFAYNGSSNTLLASFRSDSNATVHITVTVESDGSFKVYRGDSAGTLLGQSAAGIYTFTPASWQYIEVKAILDDTNGYVIIHHDGVLAYSLGPVDTKNAGTKTKFDSFKMGSGTFDDIYLCNTAGAHNTDFLGPVRIEAYHPNGDGTTSGMTNSNGNFTNNSTYVDDIFQGGTSAVDYVSGITTGDKDTYAFENSSQTGAKTIFGVMVHSLSEKTDAGARGLDLLANLSGTEVAQTPVSMNTSPFLTNGTYVWGWSCFEAKPGGGSWTVTDFNNAEFGQKAT